MTSRAGQLAKTLMRQAMRVSRQLSLDIFGRCSKRGFRAPRGEGIHGQEGIRREGGPRHSAEDTTGVGIISCVVYTAGKY